MTSPEYTHERPATPEQAQALLTEVGALSTEWGNDYGTDVSDLPTEVAKHLSTSEAAYETKDSVYVTRIFDRKTGQPSQDGEVGLVSFTRAEKPAPGLTYAAHANYHITTQDGGATYSLERHITNTEHGLHKVRERQRYLGRAMISPVVAVREMLEELTGLIDRLDATRPVEQAMGMSTVTQAEAQQIVDFMKQLNSEQ